MKRKTKKELEQEILELKQDIYYLVSPKSKFIDKAKVNFKWNIIFDMENNIWSGNLNLQIFCCIINFYYICSKLELIRMAFEKGKEKTGGRQVGSINKLTKTVKERVLEVFNELQDDPKANMLNWAKEEPTEFYKIAAKLIPADINAKVEGKIITVTVPD